MTRDERRIRRLVVVIDAAMPAARCDHEFVNVSAAE